MKQAKFYHAGCPVCVEAETEVVKAIDTDTYSIEIIHLGNDSSRITEAESTGIQSVPALTLDGTVFHINFGASISDLK